MCAMGRGRGRNVATRSLTSWTQYLRGKACVREPTDQMCGGATGSTQSGRSPDRGELVRKVPVQSKERRVSVERCGGGSRRVDALTAGIGRVLRTGKQHRRETGFVALRG